MLPDGFINEDAVTVRQPDNEPHKSTDHVTRHKDKGG